MELDILKNQSSDSVNKQMMDLKSQYEEQINSKYLILAKPWKNPGSIGDIQYIHIYWGRKFYTHAERWNFCRKNLSWVFFYQAAGCWLSSVLK